VDYKILTQSEYFVTCLVLSNPGGKVIDF